MSLGFLSAVLLANGAAVQATDAAAQTAAPRDERVVVLPGEPPIPRDPAAVEAAPPAGGDSSEIGPDGRPVIVVSGQSGPPPGDPIAELNVEAFEATQAVDEAVVEPIATAYRDDFPKPLRDGLRNFFRNLREPVVFLSYMLQLKPGKAMETLGRFAINTTIGLGGLLDQAKNEPFHLPYRKNGLANTLGYYGVGPGPFLYLPLLGATTVRDLLGGLADQAILPNFVGKPFDKPYYSAPSFVVTALEERIEFDSAIEGVRDADDPYTALREAYLERRRLEIEALHGRLPPAAPPPTAPSAAPLEDAATSPPPPITTLPDPAGLGTDVSVAPGPAAPPAVAGEALLEPAL